MIAELLDTLLVLPTSAVVTSGLSVVFVVSECSVLGSLPFSVTCVVLGVVDCSVLLFAVSGKTILDESDFSVVLVLVILLDGREAFVVICASIINESFFCCSAIVVVVVVVLNGPNIAGLSVRLVVGPGVASVRLVLE